jgi:quinoprotein dehydrogenase-associated probable ABC transporter substrate-binding protein
MSSLCRKLQLGVLVAGCALLARGASPERVLRVCADPNNLPFSNDRREGFENRLAEMMARELGAKLEFVWWSERQSLVKNTLESGRCDALMGIPSAQDEADVTRSYYRSTYVFVSRRDRGLKVTSLNDPRLSKLRIGIHVVGGDYAPPAHALARRGLAANLKPYSLFGALGEANPPARLMDAVAKGEVDLGIVWGPLAGYFAKRESEPLEIVPVSPAMSLSIPFTYDFSIGVRKGNDSLRRELDNALERQCANVRALLAEYTVPLAGKGGAGCESSQHSPVSSR